MVEPLIAASLRKVKTQAGVDKFGQPLGSVIVTDGIDSLAKSVKGPVAYLPSAPIKDSKADAVSPSKTATLDPLAFVSNKQVKFGTVNLSAKGTDPERFVPKTSFGDGVKPTLGAKVVDADGNTGTVTNTYQTHSAVHWDNGSKKTVHNIKLNNPGGSTFDQTPAIAKTETQLPPGPSATAAPVVEASKPVSFVSNKQVILGAVNLNAKGKDPDRFIPKRSYSDGITPVKGGKVIDSDGRVGTVIDTYQTHTAVAWEDGSKKTVKNDKLNSHGISTQKQQLGDDQGKTAEQQKAVHDAQIKHQQSQILLPSSASIKSKNAAAIKMLVRVREERSKARWAEAKGDAAKVKELKNADGQKFSIKVQAFPSKTPGEVLFDDYGESDASYGTWADKTQGQKDIFENHAKQLLSLPKPEIKVSEVIDSSDDASSAAPKSEVETYFDSMMGEGSFAKLSNKEKSKAISGYKSLITSGKLVKNADGTHSTAQSKPASSPVSFTKTPGQLLHEEEVASGKSIGQWSTMTPTAKDQLEHEAKLKAADGTHSSVPAKTTGEKLASGQSLAELSWSELRAQIKDTHVREWAQPVYSVEALPYASTYDKTPGAAERLKKYTETQKIREAEKQEQKPALDKAAAEAKIDRVKLIRELAVRGNDSMSNIRSDKETPNFVAEGINFDPHYLGQLSNQQLKSEINEANTYLSGYSDPNSKSQEQKSTLIQSETGHQLFKTPRLNKAEAAHAMKAAAEALLKYREHHAPKSSLPKDVLEHRIAEADIAAKAAIKDALAKIAELDYITSNTNKTLDSYQSLQWYRANELVDALKAPLQVITAQQWAQIKPDYSSLAKTSPDTDADRWENTAVPEGVNDKVLTQTDSDAKLTPEQRQKIRDMYVIDDARNIKYQAELRSGNPSKGAVAYANKTSKMINQEHLKEDATFYRGMALSPQGAAQFVPGATFRSAGFSSTDVTKSAAEFYANTRVHDNPGTKIVIADVRVPKGHAVANVDYGEMVLDRNSSFKIISAHEDENGIVRVVMEALPPEKKLTAAQKKAAEKAEAANKLPLHHQVTIDSDAAIAAKSAGYAATFPPPSDPANFPIRQHKEQFASYKAWQLDLKKNHSAAFEAVRAYMGSGFKSINGHLRGKEKGDKHTTDRIAEIDKALLQQPLTEATTVYRGIKSSSYVRFKSLKPGDEFSDKGFVSTTVEPGHIKELDMLIGPAASAVTMEVRLPAGTPAAYVTGTGAVQGGTNATSHNKWAESEIGEGELLLARDLTFRVLAHDPKSKHFVIEAIIDPQAAEKAKAGTAVKAKEAKKAAELKAIEDQKTAVEKAEAEKKVAEAKAAAEKAAAEAKAKADAEKLAKFLADAPKIDSDEVLAAKSSKKFPKATDPAKFPNITHKVIFEKYKQRQLDSFKYNDHKEHTAISEYMTNGYKGINKPLRAGGKLDASTYGTVKDIDRALKRQPLDAPVTVYRAMQNYDRWKDMKPGDEYVDKGFVSTTVDPEELLTLGMLVGPPAKSTTMEIRVPAGIRAMYLGGMHQIKDDTYHTKSEIGTHLDGVEKGVPEAELLLARGLTFRVLANDSKSKHLVVEIVPIEKK